MQKSPEERRTWNAYEICWIHPHLFQDNPPPNSRTIHTKKTTTRVGGNGRCTHWARLCLQRRSVRSQTQGFHSQFRDARHRERMGFKHPKLASGYTFKEAATRTSGKVRTTPGYLTSLCHGKCWRPSSSTASKWHSATTKTSPHSPGPFKNRKRTWSSIYQKWRHYTRRSPAC